MYTIQMDNYDHDNLVSEQHTFTAYRCYMYVFSINPTLDKNSNYMHVGNM